MVRPAPRGIAHRSDEAEGERKSQNQRHFGDKRRDKATKEEKGEACNKALGHRTCIQDGKSENKSGSGEDNTKKKTKRRAVAKEDADTEAGDPFASSERSGSTREESGESCGTD